MSKPSLSPQTIVGGKYWYYENAHSIDIWCATGFICRIRLRQLKETVERLTK
jgi:hypothetical protein